MGPVKQTVTENRGREPPNGPSPTVAPTSFTEFVPKPLGTGSGTGTGTGLGTATPPPPNQHPPPNPPPAAHAIGVEFVTTYYAAMRTRLDALFRFYAEDSSLCVSGVPQPFSIDGDGFDGEKTAQTQSPMIAATGLSEIDRTLQQLAKTRGDVCVATVDALHSTHGSVVVVVTGTCFSVASGDGDARIKKQAQKPAAPQFAQTFVLAPQLHGFYVKNDLVRFFPGAGVVEEDTFEGDGVVVDIEVTKNVTQPESKLPRPVTAPVTVQSFQPLPVTTEAVDAKAEPPAPENPIALQDLEAKQLVGISLNHETETETKIATVGGVAQTPASSAGTITALLNVATKNVPTKNAVPAVPFSYATALLVAKEAAAANKVQASLMTTTTTTNGDRSKQSLKSVGGGGAVPAPHGKEPRPVRDPSSDPFTSLFVRNFPTETEAGDLVDAFQVYGALKNGHHGVTLRVSKNQKSDHRTEKHAFVEFVDAQSASAALIGQTTVRGVLVGVEAKRERGAFDGGGYGDVGEGDGGVFKREPGVKIRDRNDRRHDRTGLGGGGDRNGGDRSRRGPRGDRGGDRGVGDRGRRKTEKEKEKGEKGENTGSDGGFAEVGGRRRR